ncbi:AAA family ATPase [Alteriqipengyuania sp. NZ-12B]|uniref:AAA family ATPase n=1 Tax=Alteriqipengyuania abyssalis TaxID=2860200 RepID=A0ABS7P959_9SPHN|nr:AAA family ATPase [Alteriqipengyuania abyssalis]MBY8335589.1 AAA family ATPase [Alteriqipengyuania abyssalis]
MNVDAPTLFKLFEAAISADYTTVRRIGGQLARKLAEEKDPEAAKALQALLRKRGVPLQASGYVEALPRDAGSRLPLVEEEQWPTTPLFLNEESSHTIEQFLEDAANISMLSEEGVSSRLGVLLYGAPGTGKSLLAGHIAAKLARPFYVARLDSVISSRLGETSKNIRSMFDFIPTKEAVLFLDEMDAIAKLRDDRHELGELKRVVNTVLQGLDSLTDDVIVIGATNHPHLLDPAIWRRFPYKVELRAPDEDVRAAMWLHFLYQDRDAEASHARLLARLSAAMSGAEIEGLSLAARRRSIINKQPPNLPHILLAIDAASDGVPRLPAGHELSPEERKRLARMLVDKGDLPQTEIAQMLGVSRQMVHRYLREEKDGE